jgi:hypothetical protein
MDSSGVHALTRLADGMTGSDIIIQASRQVTILDIVGFTKGGWEGVVVLPPPENDGG